MVETKPTSNVRLPADVKQKLTDLRADIDKSRGDLEAMKSLGIDVSDIQSKLEWADKARDVLLKQFG